MSSYKKKPIPQPAPTEPTVSVPEKENRLVKGKMRRWWGNLAPWQRVLLKTAGIGLTAAGLGYGAHSAIRNREHLRRQAKRAGLHMGATARQLTERGLEQGKIYGQKGYEAAKFYGAKYGPELKEYGKSLAYQGLDAAAVVGRGASVLGRGLIDLGGGIAEGFMQGDVYPPDQQMRGV